MQGRHPIFGWCARKQTFPIKAMAFAIAFMRCDYKFVKTR